MLKEGTILVVESDDLVRGLLVQWLGDAGYTVSVLPARDRLTAPIRADVPQLIILDAPRPRSAESEIQSLKEAYPSPILMLSARFRRGLGDTTDTAYRLGVRKVLPKPFTREELLRAVRDSLNGPNV